MNTTGITPLERFLNPAAQAGTRPPRLREAAGQAVGSVFFGTLLKMMRESDLKGGYGHGGRGEDVFSAQLHGLFAERLGGAVKTPLTEAIVRTLERQQRLMDGRRFHTRDQKREGV